MGIPVVRTAVQTEFSRTHADYTWSEVLSIVSLVDLVAIFLSGTRFPADISFHFQKRNVYIPSCLDSCDWTAVSRFDKYVDNRIVSPTISNRSSSGNMVDFKFRQIPLPHGPSSAHWCLSLLMASISVIRPKCKRISESRMLFLDGFLLALHAENPFRTFQFHQQVLAS